MNKFAQIIKTDGTLLPLIPARGKRFQLSELQTIVGGYIQVALSRNKGWLLVINEEGKLNGLPVNEKATLLYPFGYQDPIVGDAALIHQSQIN